MRHETQVKHCADCGKKFTKTSNTYTIAIEGPDVPYPAQQLAPLLQFSIVCRKCFKDLISRVEAPPPEPDYSYHPYYNF